MKLEIKTFIDDMVESFNKTPVTAKSQMELAQWVTTLINENWLSRFEILTYLESRLPHI